MESSSKDYNIISCIVNGSGLTEELVVVELSNKSAFDRKVHRTFEKQIDVTWNELVKENPRLFNGLKFRLHLLNMDEEHNILNLQIGLTCYKDFLGTNCSPNVEMLQSEGVTEHGDAQVYLSEAFAVGGLVLCTDHKFLIIHRSQHVSEGQGMLDRPGGHAEPEMTSGWSEEGKLTNVSSADVVHELFDSIRRELVDEINISMSTLTETYLLGFVRNNLTGGRASAEFLIRCSLSSAEVRARYEEGTQSEADESVALHCWSQEDLLTAHSRPQTWATLTPGLKGAIQLYQQLRK